jgi:hypothetical protein
MAAELASNLIGGLGSPAAWLAGQVAALPVPQFGPGAVLAAALTLVAVNAVVAARATVIDYDQAPIVGRVVVGLMLGLPLAIGETAVAVALWLVLA